MRHSIFCLSWGQQSHRTGKRVACSDISCEVTKWQLLSLQARRRDGEAVQGELGGGPPLAPPAGLISHAEIGEGADFFTVTVWNSKEAYDAFAPIFAKAMGEMGFQFGAPQILPVHHFLPPSTH